MAECIANTSGMRGAHTVCLSQSRAAAHGHTRPAWRKCKPLLQARKVSILVQIRSGLHRRCGPAGMRAGRVCRQAAARCSTRTGRPEEGFPLLAPSPGTQPEDESRAYNCEIPASFFSFLDASAPKESTALVVLCTLKHCVSGILHSQAL